MISIVIPVLNEEKTIEALLKTISSLPQEKEIIVVDGGSVDDTVPIAAKFAKIISSKKGRAVQMNTGAQNAAGEILWFLHSDSIIDPNSLVLIQNAMSRGAIAGCFSLSFYDNQSRLIKAIAKGSNRRARILGWIFGDQGLFVEKVWFDKLGGFPNIELMEDFAFSRTLKKQGKIAVLEENISTSSRRFTSGGIFKTLVLMQCLKALYIIGVSPSKLKKIYKDYR